MSGAGALWKGGFVPPTRILVLCSGNSCRSPMAAALIARELAAVGADARVSSAGLAGPTGSPASAAAVAVMAEVGVDLAGHTSRIVAEADIDQADLIVVMTDAHRSEVARLGAGADRIRVLGVADPFGSTPDRYRETRDRLFAEAVAIAHELDPDGPRSWFSG